MGESLFAINGFFMSVAIMITVLVFIFIAAFYISKFRIRWLHETGVSVVIGMAIGIIARRTIGHAQAEELFGFSPNLFFIMLLPLIIFTSAYNMKQSYFFANSSASSFVACARRKLAGARRHRAFVHARCARARRAQQAQHAADTLLPVIYCLMLPCELGVAQL